MKEYVELPVFNRDKVTKVDHDIAEKLEGIRLYDFLGKYCFCPG